MGQPTKVFNKKFVSIFCKRNYYVTFLSNFWWSLNRNKYCYSVHPLLKTKRDNLAIGILKGPWFGNLFPSCNMHFTLFITFICKKCEKQRWSTCIIITKVEKWHDWRGHKRIRHRVIIKARDDSTLSSSSNHHPAKERPWHKVPKLKCRKIQIHRLEYIRLSSVL